jgi:hypothetical protein
LIIQVNLNTVTTVVLLVCAPLQSGRYSDFNIRNAAPAVGLVCVIPSGTAVSIERRMAQGLFQVEILEGEHKGRLLLAQDDWLAPDKK